MTTVDLSHSPNLRHDHASREHAVEYNRIKRATLPIPDLRFEQSYLRSLRRFIHFQDVKPQEDKESKSAGLAVTSRMARSWPYGVPLVIDWGWVLYITARDQIMSPFAQGAVLAVAALYLRPFFRVIGARIRTNVVGTWRSIFSPMDHGSGWARRQMREISTTGISTNIAFAR